MRGLLSLALLSSFAGCGARSSLDADELCVANSEVELCDGVDNDCDGQIDEGIAPLRCGDNGCQVEVRCEGGVMPACVPRTPEPESCNLRDDDCDGEVDEGFGIGPVGDVVVLRSDEFDTGGCSTCSWAWGTTLAPAGDGFLALWNLGLSGGSEQPTLYGRSLDRFGNPTSAIALQRQDFILDLQPILALEPPPARGLALEAVYREGTDDVFGFLFANTVGETETLKSSPASGPRNVERTVWTGERFISAWEEGNRLHVAVLAADGTFERSVEVDALERPASITLGVYPDRVGILVARYRDNPERRDQWLIVLDAFGNVQQPAREIAVEWTSWQRLVGTEGGWLHIRPNDYQVPSTRQRLDVAGDPLGEALQFADARDLDSSGGQSTFIPRPGVNEMFMAWQAPEGGDMHVEFLDDAGNLLRGWSGPVQANPGNDEGFFANPHVAFVDDHLLLIWHGLADSDRPNRVSVQAFGCVP